MKIKVKINDIDFEIVDITETRKGNVNYHYIERKMTATTNINNFEKIDYWFNSIFRTDYSYKKDIIYNGFEIYGIYLVNYGYNNYNIYVDFSFDYINGDIELFKLKQERKEKLKKIYEKC